MAGSAEMFDVGHYKIMARREAETTLMRRTYYASSHRTCQEGAIPSGARGARHRRAGNQIILGLVP